MSTMEWLALAYLALHLPWLWWFRASALANVESTRLNAERGVLDANVCAANEARAAREEARRDRDEARREWPGRHDKKPPA